MSKKTTSNNSLPEEEDKTLNINHLTIPIYIAHLKPGLSLCTNNHDTFVLQNGSTTLEVRTAPNFEPKTIPWRDGLIRDIVWCPELHVFVLLTQKTLFTFDPRSITAPATTTINTDIQLKITAYSQIKPFDDRHSFWRCATVGTRIFITYSGFGTVIDEYTIGPASSNFVKRWMPPRTCAEQDGIWCIRHDPKTDQIGMSIMNGQDNQWRFEIRNRRDLSIIWRMSLPVTHGDCEISPLINDQWLVVNSCGVRLLQIADRRLKAAVEYERELRNAISLGKNYFIVRTKNTLEIHSIKEKKK